MQTFKIKIPQATTKQDLTILYKEGDKPIRELKTSKKDLLNTLHYFENRVYEIKQMSLIYIEEDIDFDIFQQFISSITTHEVGLNEQNYEQYYYLSQKYEYNELRSQISQFISERPDINLIITDLSSDSKSQQEIDYEKEELIAKNIDVSIKSGNLTKLPLKILNRVLNSPKRVIHDHHLLFSFVISLLKEKRSKKTKPKQKREQEEEEEEDLMILPSCLDYCEMSSDEIRTLFDVEKSHEFFQPRNAVDRMKAFIREEEEMKGKLAALAERVGALERVAEENSRAQKEMNSVLLKKQEEGMNEMKRQKEEFEAKMKKIEASIRKESNESIESVRAKIRGIEEKQKALEREQLMSKQAGLEQKARIDENKKEIEKLRIKSDEANLKISDALDFINSPISVKDGIFKYLFGMHNNPVQKGLIEIDGNSYDSVEKAKLPRIIGPNYTGPYWYSEDTPNSYIRITFKSLVKLQKYRLHLGYGGSGCGFLTKWSLKGTTDDNREIVLSEVDKSNEISESNLIVTVPIQRGVFVRSVKLVMNGKSSTNDYTMRVRNIELYGYLKA